MFFILFKSFFNILKHSIQFFLFMFLTFESCFFFFGQMKEASIIELTLDYFAINIIS